MNTRGSDKVCFVSSSPSAFLLLSKQVVVQEKVFPLRAAHAPLSVLLNSHAQGAPWHSVLVGHCDRHMPMEWQE